MGGKKNEDKFYLFVNPSSLKKLMILKLQKKLDGVIEELKHEKERAEVLKRRQQADLLQNFRTGITNMKRDELVALKVRLEAVQEIIKRKKMEIEASSSQKEK
ncbi:hypothetical protein HA466_0271670 [Hirschfeldia incana]|nr:hypothetical protein HA466_0271670 [Hirschfeldia incana]